MTMRAVREPEVRFRVDLPLDKIQAIRLCMAIAESDYAPCIPSEMEPTFRRLDQLFPAPYVFGADGALTIPNVEISHAEPRCRMGHIVRPLIFPHAIFDHCRANWRAHRPTRYSFCGLVTPERKQALEEWIARSFPNRRARAHIRVTPVTRRQRLRACLAFGGRETARYSDIGLTLYSSARGRRFPGKVWDEKYYDLLASSQFALCPNGDFVWTYRFFEAVLCGAIPIVENRCALYDGFTFHSLADPGAGLRWSVEAAEANFQRARTLLTIPRDELNACLAALLPARSPA